MVVCAALSFFFALAESSLFSLGKWRAQQLAEESPQGKPLFALMQAPEDLLATIVLGNTFANCGLVGVALWMLLREGAPMLLPMLGLFVFLLVGCEVVPKTFGVRAPEFWAFRLVRPMNLIIRVIRPIRQVGQRGNNLILQALIPKSVRPQPQLSDAEYKELLELACQQGALAQTEKQIILQILRLDQRAAAEVMRPRSQMAAIPDDLSVGEMVDAARKYKYSRLPVYDETPDTIVGVLNTRALILDPEMDLADAIDFPSFVPASMNLLQLLRSLQKQRRGMAIVLDEFGGTGGLVTLDDILRETIGGFRGEESFEGFVLEKTGPGKWRASGNVRIDDFRREHPELGEVDEVDTLAGLLAMLLEVVPAAGQSAWYRGLRLTATKVDDRRVKELLVETARN